MTQRVSYQDGIDMTKAAAAVFPETFGLRRYPGETFRINVSCSFYSHETGVQLYLDILVTEASPKTTPARMGQPEGSWMNFLRESVENIKTHMVTL